MINQAYAFQVLVEKFGKREFTAKEAAEALSPLFTGNTPFVALSNMNKSGSLSRIRKGLYIIKGHEQHGLKSLSRPEFIFPNNAYATGTYALSVNLTPFSAPGYLDIFVQSSDFPRIRSSVETESYPQPRVHPFATQNTPQLERSPDGFPIPVAPEVAFVDLIKIAAEKSRPVSLEYEIIPYIPQLVGRWSEVISLASCEEIREYLDAIVSYSSMIASREQHTDISLPPTSAETPRNSVAPPRILSFEGGNVDETSIEVARQTGVLIEANKEAVASTFGNL